MPANTIACRPSKKVPTHSQASQDKPREPGNEMDGSKNYINAVSYTSTITFSETDTGQLIELEIRQYLCAFSMMVNALDSSS